jgi:hypothetical protein
VYRNTRKSGLPSFYAQVERSKRQIRVLCLGTFGDPKLAAEAYAAHMQRDQPEAYAKKMAQQQETVSAGGEEAEEEEEAEEANCPEGVLQSKPGVRAP